MLTYHCHWSVKLSPALLPNLTTRFLSHRQSKREAFSAADKTPVLSSPGIRATGAAPATLLPDAQVAQAAESQGLKRHTCKP